MLGGSGSWSSNQEFDYLPRDFAAWFAKAYAGEQSLIDVRPATAVVVESSVCGF